MTKYIGERIRYEHSNYVIKASEVSDPTARRLLRDPRAVNTTLKYLKSVDNRYDIISDFDDFLGTTMKEIKYVLGDSFKLQALRENHKTLYNRLTRLGNPRGLLEEHGFNVEVGNAKLSRKTIRARLWSLADEEGRVVGLDRRSPSTYAVISRLARNSDVTIKEYIERELGFKYGKKST